MEAKHKKIQNQKQRKVTEAAKMKALSEQKKVL
jgi:hypothetical protein